MLIHVFISYSVSAQKIIGRTFAIQKKILLSVDSSDNYKDTQARMVRLERKWTTDVKDGRDDKAGEGLLARVVSCLVVLVVAKAEIGRENDPPTLP